MSAGNRPVAFRRLEIGTDPHIFAAVSAPRFGVGRRNLAKPGRAGPGPLTVRSDEYLDLVSVLLERPQVAVVIVGFVAVQLYPVIEPVADLTVRDTAVSPAALNVMSIIALVFLPAVALGFVMLYSVFDETPEADGGY